MVAVHGAVAYLLKDSVAQLQAASDILCSKRLVGCVPASPCAFSQPETWDYRFKLHAWRLLGHVGASEGEVKRLILFAGRHLE